MKKLFRILSIISHIFVLFSLFSCFQNVNEPDKSNETNMSGKLSGKVIYSNIEDSNYGGIIVTLDKTDGLRTMNVMQCAASRNIVTSARNIVANSVTKDDGSYLFVNLEPGTYTIYAVSSYSKERAVYTNVVVRSEEETFADVMTLTATGRITGKITLDEGDSGNTGFLVFIAGTSYMAITDDAGNYTISDVPAGNGYQLVVMKNNVMHFLDTDVVVNANSSTSIATNNFTSKELKASDGKDGADGTSIVWLGSFEDESEIENPQYLNAYFNMKDGCSYIYDGTKWTLLSAKGDKGDNGTDGKDGENGSNGTNGKDALAIGTVLSTEELTNQNVIITVNITQADISKIGYVYSSDNQNWNTANSILTNSDFISIQPDSNGKYQVVADKNGYYAFAVKNSDGYSAFTEEYITNIDKTAPGPVSNLIAKYNKNTKVLSVTWTNPTDSDFDYAILGYTKGGVTVTSNVRITNGTYTLSDVEVDGDEYVFTVYAKDKTGNTSNLQTVNVTPVDGPKVQSMTLSRYHWAYNDPDQTVIATALISNADLIEDGTVVKFQTKDPNGNITNTVATVDRTQETATAIITAPSESENSSTTGTVYTVMCMIGDELADTIHTARFNVSSDIVVNGINKSVNNPLNIIQIPLSEVNSETSANLTLSGYNLDVVKISIQLINSTGGAYFAEPIEIDNSSISWTATKGENKQSLKVSFAVPQIDDMYLVRFLFDGVVQEGYLKLQVYDVPKFSNFSIPLVSTTKAGNKVTAKITGKNFDTPNVNFDNLIATCTNNSNIVSSTTFTKESDSVIYATLIIPEKEGEYDVNIAYGNNSITSKLKVKDFSTYSVGDVLLNDDTIIRYSEGNLFTEEQKKDAVCVLAYFNDYGVPVGVGLYNSTSGINNGKYKWAPKDLLGYNTKFSKIVCTPSDEGSGVADYVTFEGDIDGGDNWANIYSEDSLGKLNASIYHPAFDYVNNYATSFGLSGKFEYGWYMPTIAELCFIYRNKDVLNMVINTLGGVELDEKFYSSSQNEVGIGTWFLRFSTGYVGKTPKDYDNYVCVVRPFE